MSSNAQATTVSKQARRAGVILSAVPALMLVFSAGIKFLSPPTVVKEFGRLGYPESLIVPIGILELACITLYLIPRTSVLGAILVAAFLGGATATHVRIGEPFIGPVVTCAMAWLGLYLRDTRLRSLVPFRN